LYLHDFIEVRPALVGPPSDAHSLDLVLARSPPARALFSTLLLAAAADLPRAGVLLVPMDRGAEARIPQLEGYLSEALVRQRRHQTRTSDELFGVAPDREAEAALRRAYRELDRGKAELVANKPSEAERALKAAVAEFGQAAAAMDRCAGLCEALTFLGGALFVRGELEEARGVILDQLALERGFEPGVARLEREFLTFRAGVARSKKAHLGESLEVRSRPAGAQVFLNGEPRGYAPLTLDGLAVGLHLLRLERPGFVTLGRLVEVKEAGPPLTVALSPTGQYRALEAQFEKLAQEVMKEGPWPTVTSVGKALGLEQALIGVVRELSGRGGTELRVGLFQVADGQRLAERRIHVQEDEYGELKAELGRVVTGLLSDARRPPERKVKGKDPLRQRTGIEDWTVEDRGGRSGRKKDPLEGVSGTEDW
jgi:hypothetical protein